MNSSTTTRSLELRVSDIGHDGNVDQLEQRASEAVIEVPSTPARPVNQLEQLRAELTRPFRADECGSIAGRNSQGEAKTWTVVKWMAVRDRLDQVLPFRWSFEVVDIDTKRFERIDGPDEDAVIEHEARVVGRLILTVPDGSSLHGERQVHMDGIGTASDADQGNAAKAAESYALVNAAYRFGIGQELNDPARLKAIRSINGLVGWSDVALKKAVWKLTLEWLDYNEIERPERGDARASERAVLAFASSELDIHGGRPISRKLMIDILAAYWEKGSQQQ